MKRLITMALLSLLASSACATMGRDGKRVIFAEALREVRADIDHENYAPAIRELDMILAAEPHHREARFLRALALHKQGAVAGALEDYQLLMASDPHDPKPYYNVGMILAFELHQTKEALAALDHFLTLAPEHEKAPVVAEVISSLDRAAKSAEVRAALARAESLLHGGKDDAVRQLLEELVAEHPATFEAHRLLGELKQRRGDRHAAAVHFKKAALFSRRFSM